MKSKLLLLLVLAFPVFADEPGPILISPEERMAIVQKFESMQDYITKLEKGLKSCQTAQRT